MNALHHILTRIFDLLLTPLEWVGDGFALVLVSGVFGVLALLLFKQISWQVGIKSAKDKIKGHMIAIRIYQDDLGVVFGSVVKVVLRNFQYLGLNFAPILPLFAPVVLISAQLVVRYGFKPLRVVSGDEAGEMLPGRGTMLEVRMKSSRREEVSKLSVELPAHLKALSPLVRNARDGIAVMEFVAIAPGRGDARILVGGELAGTKEVVSGAEHPRSMQPERVSNFWSSWLWPAEPTFEDSSPIEAVVFEYPDRHMGFLPGGAFGVLLTFFVASILFGIAVLKPLNIQI
ncbi:MAG: hypothetical protein EXS08_15270 [Planctomycetes bacterium]|nr:hypothetical protein [Planctomycetota bacterium]